VRRASAAAWGLGALSLAAAGAARADAPADGAPAPRPLEAVVTARPEPAATPREDKAAAASVVRPEDSPRVYDDLGSLLLEVPGVTVTRTGSLGAYSTLTLRGANPDEVRIYLDGVPLNVAAGGAVDVSTLPLGDVERVEVYRGTTPLAFGESALGGIVSITTRTPGAARVAARAGAGSFGSEFGDVSAGGRAGRVRLYLGLHGLAARGDYPYLNDNGTALNTADDFYGPRPNNDALQGDGVFRAALTLAGRRTLGLGLIAFGRDEGLAGRGAFPTMTARFGTARGLATLRYESRDDLGPGGRLSVAAFASEQRDRLRDPNGELGGAPTREHATTQSFGVNAYAARPLGDWARAAVVLEGRRETYAPADDLAAVPFGIPARRLVGVAGGELDLRVRRLDLDVIPSVRAEAMEDLVSGSDLFGAPATHPEVRRVMPVWRLGLVRPLGAEAALKANVGRYGRAPSFLELYGSSNSRLLGNIDLLPERGTNADLGLWLDHAGARAAVASRTTVFAALADDLIVWQYTSWGQGRADNIGQARVWGVEQELRLAAGRWARLVGQYTYLVATDRSGTLATEGRQLPFHPRHHLYARPEIVRVPFPGGLEAAVYADADVRGETYADGANLARFPTRLLLGAGVSVARPGSHLRLTASAANLTDTRTADGLDWPLPGRSVFVALAFTPVGAGDEPVPPAFDPRTAP
jgi:iron complex outermembrane receptor protein